MKSALLLIFFGVDVCLGKTSVVVINGLSCGSEYTLGEQDEITLKYDGEDLPEKCRIKFKKIDTLIGDICFTPTFFDVDRYSGIRVEYYRYFVGLEPVEELSFASSRRWCDSAHDIYVMFLAGNNSSPAPANVQIVVQLNTGVPANSLSGVAIGIIVTVSILVAVVAILVAVFYFRRQRHINRQSCTTATSAYPMTPVVYPIPPTYTSQAGDQPQNDYQTSAPAGYRDHYQNTAHIPPPKYEYAFVNDGYQPDFGYAPQPQGYSFAQTYPIQSGYHSQSNLPAGNTENTSLAQSGHQPHSISPSLEQRYLTEYQPHDGIVVLAPQHNFAGNHQQEKDASDPPPPYSH